MRWFRFPGKESRQRELVNFSAKTPRQAKECCDCSNGEQKSRGRFWHVDASEMPEPAAEERLFRQMM